jgi:hypothetical protein
VARADRRSELRRKVCDVERLRQDRGRADGLPDARCVVLRAYDDDRSIRSALLVVRTRELFAARLGKHEVEHDRARLDRERRAKGMLAVQRRDRLVALVGDGRHEHPACVGVVLDDEHAFWKPASVAHLVLHLSSPPAGHGGSRRA